MSSPARLSEIVAQGRWGTVECAVRLSGVAPAKDFLLNDLQNIREKTITATARFAVLFQQMANVGDISPKRFGKEMGKLYAFKHAVRNVQIRFPCFQDGNRWILTHGFLKPGARKGKGKWPESQIKRANEIMSEYFQRKEKAAENAKRGKQ